MSFTSFSRRRLLASIAAAGGASRLSPFVPASVYAAEAPKRILTIFHPMGYLEKEFFPTGTGANFTLGSSLQALEPWKSKLTFLDGLAVYGPQYYFNFADNEHGLGAAMCFTGGKFTSGWSDSPSVDQAIADFQYNQVKTQFRSLTLGVNSSANNGHTAVFYSKGGTAVTPQKSPQATFDQLFRGFSGPTAAPSGGAAPNAGVTPASPPAIDTSAKDRLLAQEQSILNMVKGDLERVRALAGKEDQIKLDTHLGGISNLENRLKILAGGAGSAPTTRPVGSTSAPPVSAGSVTMGCAKPTLPAGAIDASVHAQMDLIVAAFACDMTRSASLQLGICDGQMDEANPGINQHDTTHSSGPGVSQATLDSHKKYDRWYAARWAYLLNKLDSIKEGNGTLLDNTLVVFASDTYTAQGAGGDMGPHSHVRFPMWMAGGGAFAFKTGQAINLPVAKRFASSKENLTKDWVVHHRLLTSICQAFGMPVDSFGGNDPGKGGIPQLVRA